MLKLLRVMKLKKLLMRFEDYIVSDSMDLLVTFLNITVKVIVIAHYMSCLFFYVGMDEIRAGRESWIMVEEVYEMELS